MICTNCSSASPIKLPTENPPELRLVDTSAVASAYDKHVFTSQNTDDFPDLPGIVYTVKNSCQAKALKIQTYSLESASQQNFAEAQT